MSSSAAPTGPIQSAAQGPANNKKKGNKKKKANKSSTVGGTNTDSTTSNTQIQPPAPETNTNGEDDGVESAPVEEVSEELETLDLSTTNSPPAQDAATDELRIEPNGPDTETVDTEIEAGAKAENDSTSAANGHAGANGHAPTGTASGVTSAKLEAMSQDREALRLEVEQLRKQLESIQESHVQETTELRAELDESEAAKEHAEAQYQTLLTRVEKIKETLGDRLKRDKAELGEAKDRIEELETQNDELQRAVDMREEEADRLRNEVQEQGRELTGLRSRTNLSQQNRLKEKDDITRQMQHLKSELESTTAAMGEWEVIAMEERSLRESLSDKVSDLEEQLTGAREAYERADADRDAQSQAVDRLQRALQELQETRKRELREMVESTEEQVQALKKRAQDADAKAAEAESARETLSKELERTVPFEKEVKEKNLLIGKLRHEAIVLNDHLTKALKYIKKTKPEETIDKQLVTNHFLQFLSLDRSDPRKFQILQVMANLLSWNESQREKAGLARPGGAPASGNSLRLPASPFHRTPSSPALNSEFFAEQPSASMSTGGGAAGSGGGGSGGGGGKETLADLWANFLEQSVEDASSAAGTSRKGSMASVSTAGGGRPDTRGA